MKMNVRIQNAGASTRKYIGPTFLSDQHLLSGLIKIKNSMEINTCQSTTLYFYSQRNKCHLNTGVCYSDVTYLPIFLPLILQVRITAYANNDGKVMPKRKYLNRKVVSCRSL